MFEDGSGELDQPEPGLDSNIGSSPSPKHSRYKQILLVLVVACLSLASLLVLKSIVPVTDMNYTGFVVGPESVVNTSESMLAESVPVAYRSVENDSDVESAITASYRQGSNLIVEFRNPLGKEVRVEGLGSDRYALEKNRLVVYNYKNERFRLVIGASSDIYEFGITIINVQSYPTIGGNWNVKFTTEGIADLIITAVNVTTWTDYAESGYDLKFLEVKCGSQVLDYEWINGSVVVRNYNCAEEGLETSKVLTAGKHTLEFRFGDDAKYAYNQAGWLSGWYYRKAHNVTGTTAGAQTNYTINLTIFNTSGTDSGSNVYIGTKGRIDFGDIRFVNSTGSLMDYWIENVSNTNAKLWVEIPSIPASPNNETIYIYYGNSDASSISNGANTFPFFDDFSTNTIGTKWATNGGSWSVDTTNGLLNGSASSSSYGGLRATSTFNSSRVMFEVRGMEKVNNAVGEFGVQTLDFTPSGNPFSTREWYRMLFDDTDNSRYVQRYTDPDSSALANSTGSYTSTIFYRLSIGLLSTYVKYFIDGSFVNQSGNNFESSDVIRLELYVWDTGSTSVDWVLVRNYTDPEPSHGSWGSEETETIAPLWRNQTTNDTDNIINQGEAINLTAQGYDETALDWAWLSTNESGVWRNYTDVSWWNSSWWQYRKVINISNPGSAKTNYQVNISLDTQSLISANKMQSDCDDIRFISSSNNKLSYWLESGCNSASTIVWVNVSNIPAGDSTIYVYYSNPSAISESLSWSGNLTLMFLSCPGSWVRVTSLDNKFPRGSSTYGGTGGSETHTHSYSGTTDTSGVTRKTDGTGSDNVNYVTHTHTYSGTTGSKNHLPPYLDVIFCNISSIPSTLPNGSIAIFNTSSLPTNWSLFTPLDNKFPRGSSTYGGIGGYETHTHSYSGTTDTSGVTRKVDDISGDNVNYVTHTHTYSGTTGSKNHLPPYLNVTFANSSVETSLPGGIIAIFDALPPAGWSLFTPLDNKFPRGSSTYGGTGGSETHTQHTISGTTGTSGVTRRTDDVSGDNVNYVTHTHGYSTTTGQADNMPPYLNVIFAIRLSPNVTSSVGGEENYTYGSPNYTYGSPVGMNNAAATWTWSNFTWSNSSVADDTVVSWRIYYNDTSGGNVNVTGIMNFSVSRQPLITIQSPSNQSYATSNVWANVTLNKTGSWCGAELDSTTNYTMSNSSGNWNYQLSLSIGAHHVKFYCNSSFGAMNSTDKRYFYVDACSYGGSGTWTINCAEGCTISSVTDIGTNKLVLSGTGSIYMAADVTAGQIVPGSGCRLVFAPGKRLILRHA